MNASPSGHSHLARHHVPIKNEAARRRMAKWMRMALGGCWAITSGACGFWCWARVAAVSAACGWRRSAPPHPPARCHTWTMALCESCSMNAVLPQCTGKRQKILLSMAAMQRHRLKSPLCNPDTWSGLSAGMWVQPVGTASWCGSAPLPSAAQRRRQADPLHSLRSAA
jgi:hypothetical protein